MNRKQFIFLTIIIILLNIITLYLASGVEDWWGPIPINPVHDVLASLFLVICVAVDMGVILWFGDKFYNWLGEK